MSEFQMALLFPFIPFLVLIVLEIMLPNDDNDDIGVDTEALSGYLSDTSGDIHTKEYNTLGIADLQNQYCFAVKISGTIHQSFELDEVVLTYRDLGIR